MSFRFIVFIFILALVGALLARFLGRWLYVLKKKAKDAEDRAFKKFEDTIIKSSGNNTASDGFDDTGVVGASRNKQRKRQSKKK